MKKLITLLAVLLTAQALWAGNIKEVFNEFKDAEHADYVSISPFLIKIGKMFVDDEDGEAQWALKHIKSMQVLDLDDCSADVKQRFAKRISQLQLDGYEPLVRVNEDGEQVRILIKGKENVIHEMLIVCAGTDDCTLVRFKGKFKESDIDQLLNQDDNAKD